MKVLAKRDIRSLLEMLSNLVGTVYGPISKSGNETFFGKVTGDNLNLEACLPCNSLKQILIFSAKKYLSLQKNNPDSAFDPIVLFGLRPCDLKALQVLDEKILDDNGERIILSKIVGLIVANICHYPGSNCFCSQAGISSRHADGADVVLYDTGDHLLVEIANQEVLERIAGVYEYFINANEEEILKLEKIKSISIPSDQIYNLKQALNTLESAGKEFGKFCEVFEDCLNCGACAIACPVYISDEEANAIKSESDTHIHKHLQYIDILQAATNKDFVLQCTGCGRCSTVCPSDIGMNAVLDLLTGEALKTSADSGFTISEASPKWIAPIRHKISTAKQAFTQIKPGDTVFLASGCAEPQYLARQLIKNYRSFMNVQVIHLLSMGDVSFDAKELTDHLRLNAFFVGDSSRMAVQSGQADYTPVFLSELPRLLKSGRNKVDIALIQVSPPNRHNYCSLGISVETIKAAVEQARYVVAQINPKMPFTHGDSTIHLDSIDTVIPFEEDLIEWRSPPVGERNSRIGQFLAQLIDDGSTLQIGIGKIGQALLPFLEEKKNLGIHTQIITDEVLNLMNKGVVTNTKKGLNYGKSIAAFAVGTKKLYSQLDHNPAVELYGMDYVANPAVIAKNNKMTAINSVFEVDLSGQICADSLKYQFYSGIASAADYLRGAARSKGGKPIVALPSTANFGTTSRIKPRLSEGNPVTLTIGDVHYVVTEYGIAYLHGKTLRERALALIEIAHPDFREWLLEQAKELKYIYDDQQLPSLTKHNYPEEWETIIPMKDGSELLLRPIKASDEPELQRLYYSLSDQDVFMRFMGSDRHFKHVRMQAMTVLDYDQRMAIVATEPEFGKEAIMGIARYDIDPNSGIAEVAFTIRDDMRRMGIGTKMLEHITIIAKSKGVVGIRAEILARNKAMMKLFNTSGAKVNSHVEDGMYTCWYKFDENE